MIHADHKKMARFTSKEDSNYKTVAGHLQAMAENAAEVIALRWAEEARVNAGTYRHCRN
jgi:hypothetical protein